STQAAMNWKGSQDGKKLSVATSMANNGIDSPQTQQALKNYYGSFDSPSGVSNKKTYDEWYASGGSTSSAYTQSEASFQSAMSSTTGGSTGGGSSGITGGSSSATGGSSSPSSSSSTAPKSSSGGFGASFLSLPKGGGSYFLAGVNKMTASFLPPFLKGGVAGIKASAEETLGSFQKKAEEKIGSVLAKGKGVLNTAQELVDRGKDLIDSGSTKAKELVQSGRDTVDRVTEKGKEKIQEVIAKGRDKIDSILEKGRGTVDGIVSKGMGKVDGFLDKIESRTEKILGKTVSGFLRGAADRLLGKGKEKITAVLDGVQGKITGTLDTLQGKMGSLLDKSKSILGGLLDTVQGKVNGLIDSLAEKGKGLLDTIKKSKIYTSIFGSEYTLSAQDRGDLHDVFGDSLDLDKIVVHRGGFPEKIQKMFQDFGVGITLGNHVYLPDDPAYFNPDGSLTHYAREVMVHESAHVWQHQNEPAPGTGYAYLVKAAWSQILATIKSGDRNGAYEWTHLAAQGVPFESLNPEQQAHVVEEAYSEGIHNDLSAKFIRDGKDYTDYVREALRKVRAGEGAPHF
ncbi:MAG: hypothetical protein AABZ60_13580, partial [Planctomycetota bacterium]